MKKSLIIPFLLFVIRYSFAQQNIVFTPRAVKISGNLSVRDSVVIGTNIAQPQAPLDVNGDAIFRGINSNTLGTPQAGVEFFFGRGATNNIPIGVGKPDIAFNWGGPGGGFRHYITTRHNAAVGSENNAFDFYLNNTELQYDNPTGNSPAFSITAIGNKIYNNNFLEFGAGLSKEPNAGKIGYKLFSNGLDIIGAGSTNTNRRITLYAEGGTNIMGNVGIGTLNVPLEKLYVNGDAKVENNLLAAGRLNVLSKIAIGTTASPAEKLYVNGDAKVETNLSVVGNTTIVGNATISGTLSMGVISISNDYNIAAGNTTALSLACPPNTKLLTGGGGNPVFNGGTDEVFLSYNGPDTNAPLTTWVIYARNTGSVTRLLRIFCTCARIN